MNKSLLPAVLGASLTAGLIALVSNIPGAHAQAGAAPGLVPLGASGQITWYLDTKKQAVVMCNAFSDNSIECRSKPMP